MSQEYGRYSYPRKKTAQPQYQLVFSRRATQLSDQKILIDS